MARRRAATDLSAVKDRHALVGHVGLVPGALAALSGRVVSRSTVGGDQAFEAGHVVAT